MKRTVSADSTDERFFTMLQQKHMQRKTSKLQSHEPGVEY